MHFLFEVFGQAAFEAVIAGSVWLSKKIGWLALALPHVFVGLLVFLLIPSVADFLLIAGVVCSILAALQYFTIKLYY
jgi:hypothetical protein